VAQEVHETTNTCAIPQQAKQSEKNQDGVQHVKNPHVSDSIISTPVREPIEKEQAEAGELNCSAVHAPTQPCRNHVLQNTVPAVTSGMESEAHKFAYNELHKQNLKQMLLADNCTTSYDNSSTSKLGTESRDKADTSTATKAEIETEPENQKGKKSHRFVGRSSASLKQQGTNGLASAAPELSGQDANSLVLKIKQLDCSQPTRTVTRLCNTWGEHYTSHSQRQYHVDGQGDVWANYAADSFMERANYAADSFMERGGVIQGPVLPTAPLLPGPTSIPVPQSSSALGWTWDAAEGVLVSDMASFPSPRTATIDRGSVKPTQNVYRIGQMDLHGVQGMGSMAYGAATSPEIQYHAGLGPQQPNLA